MIRKFEHLKAPECFIQYNCSKNKGVKDAKEAEEALKYAKEHEYRSMFSFDRDRVIYCGAFRRLSSKTQVFHSKTADNIRTRLTHTLEVAQIARTIAHQLGLNEDLAEAIALGHDIGHTPFGHVGERTLNSFSRGADKSQKGKHIPKEYYGFKHNLQSVRVLMEYSEDLMFSNFMLFGVREHSKTNWNDDKDTMFYRQYEDCCSYLEGDKKYPAWSFEAYIVKWADEVAQRHHDIEDAYLQKIMSPDEIMGKLTPLRQIIEEKHYGEILKKFKTLEREAEKTISSPYRNNFVHMFSSVIVDSYVTILIEEFTRVLAEYSRTIREAWDFEEAYKNINKDDVEKKMMGLNGATILDVDKKLRKDLKNSILDSFEVQRMDGKGAYVIRRLVRAYISNPQQLPNNYINKIIEAADGMLVKDKFNKVKVFWEKKLPDYKDNIRHWKNYEYREALREIMQGKNEKVRRLMYPIILRIVFDYVGGMTDSFALKQYEELY